MCFDNATLHRAHGDIFVMCISWKWCLLKNFTSSFINKVTVEIKRSFCIAFTAMIVRPVKQLRVRTVGWMMPDLRFTHISDYRYFFIIWAIRNDMSKKCVKPQTNTKNRSLDIHKAFRGFQIFFDHWSVNFIQNTNYSYVF